MNSRPNWPVTLSSRQQLTPDTWQFNFKVSDPTFDYQAGQFVSLIFDWQGQSYRRSYSIANAPTDYRQTQEIELVVRCIDEGTGAQFLLHADLQSSAQMLGPLGMLVLPETPEAKRMIFMATGTGVAPFRAMLPELMQLAQLGTEVVVLLGVRTQEDYLYSQSLEALNQHSNMGMHICYSRDQPQGERQHSGYVQHQLAWLKPNPDTDLVYLCGTPAMIDESARQLSEQGFSPRKIRREKYLFSGH